MSDDLAAVVARLERENQALRERAELLRSELLILEGESRTEAERAATLADATHKVDALRGQVDELRRTFDDRERALGVEVRRRAREYNPLSSGIEEIVEVVRALFARRP